MKLFADTANLDEIKSLLEKGVVQGITTNPSLLAKEPKTDFYKHIQRICDLCREYDALIPVSVEVFATEPDSMIAQALEIHEKVDYVNLYEFHQKGGFDLTVIASAKEYIIPYGTCELNDEGHLSHINEKPQYDFLINTGLYVLSPDIIALIPQNKFYHITHLIEDAKNQGKKVGVFPVDDEAWIDVGQWAEYKKVMKLL